MKRPPAGDSRSWRPTRPSYGPGRAAGRGCKLGFPGVVSAAGTRTEITGNPTYALLRTAILERRQVQCRYDGRWLTFCPHAIGTKDWKPRVLVFQLVRQDSANSSPIPPPGFWVCLDIDHILLATMIDGPWHTGNHGTAPRGCLRSVDIDLTEDSAKAPRT